MANGQREFLSKATPTSLRNECIARFIKHCNDNNLTPSPAECEKMLLSQMRQDIMTRNSSADKTDQWKKPDSLPLNALGELILNFHLVKKISLTGDDNIQRKQCVLGVYLPDEGIYTTDTDVIDSIICKYSSSLTSKQLEEVRNYMSRSAELVKRNEDPDLTAVNNGIWNFKTQTLSPFSPDYVFTSKSDVDYNPNAQNCFITMPDGEIWDCDTQIRTLAGNDPQMEHFLWQALSATVRPCKDYNKALFYYGEGGCNGKGTTTYLQTQLVGPRASYSLSLADMAKDFKIAGLKNGAMFVYSHENDVGEFLDKSANFKNIVTHDTLLLNEKYEKPVVFRYRGLVVENINEIPRVKDSSNSYLRRIIIVPFNAKFEGQERKYIKDDYLNRKEVLEYYMKRALEMDVEEFDIPDCCFNALETFKQHNDPIVNFWNMFKDEFVWNIVPVAFLYELYKSWAADNNPQGGVIGYIKFWQQLQNIINSGSNKWSKWSNVDEDGNPCTPYISSHGTWTAVSGTKKWVGQSDMEGHEQLIIDYHLDKYINPLNKNDITLSKKTNFVRPKTINAYIERKFD